MNGIAAVAIVISMSCSLWSDMVHEVAAMDLQKRIQMAYYIRHYRPAHYRDYLLAMRYVRSLEALGRKPSAGAIERACHDLAPHHRDHPA